MNVFEVVLPVSGRFARIDRPTWGDWLVAVSHKDCPVPALMARIAWVDGERLTLEQWLASDYEDIAPLVNALNEQFKSIFSQKGVA